MIIEKQYARRELTGYRSPYHDPFTYRTLEQEGRDAFIKALALVSAGTLSRDVNPNDPERELAELIEFAGSTFNPKMWKLAFLEGGLVGLVLPQIYHDLPEEGSLFHIGVAPDHRGKGYGKILHAKGLEDLALAGAKRYVGSTDIQNVFMIQVFEANACNKTAIRPQEIHEARP